MNKTLETPNGGEQPKGGKLGLTDEELSTLSYNEILALKYDITSPEMRKAVALSIENGEKGKGKREKYEEEKI